MKKLITHAELLDRLHYDASTGAFSFATDSGRMKKGQLAGSISRGYLIVNINNGSYRAHRLAWFYVNGVWPKGEIDHINGDRSDNRICNLRDVDRRINNENQRLPKRNNKDGHYLGVSYHVAAGKFRARIKVTGQDIHLGLFDTRDEARNAYLTAKHCHHKGAAR